ncbi:MAG: hypothetical protein AAGC64_08155 [Bacteroidota bacterium]
MRFLYDEVNEDERLEIKESLCSNVDLRANLEELKEAMSILDGFFVKTPNDVVSKILQASKNLQSA